MSSRIAERSPLASPPAPSADWLGLSATQWREMEELPACCAGTRKQLAVDIDETVHGGKKVAELWRQSGTAATALPAGPTAATPVAPVAVTTGKPPSVTMKWAQRLPKPHVPWPMTALTLWTAIPGLVFSWQNYGQAQKVSALLRTLDDALVRRVAANGGVQQSASLLATANLQAYRDTVAHSLSMQRFIAHFAGALAGASSLLVISTLFFPVVEPYALGALVGYCASFALRYTRWDQPRQAQPSVAVQRSGSLADEGYALAEATRRERHRLFAKTGLCFALYGVGAGLLVLSSFWASVGLTVAGMTSLFVGMVAVTYLNNFPIKETFGKNRDRHINREQLGDTDSIYRTLGVRARQRALLSEFDTKMAKLAKAGRDWKDVGYAAVEGVVIGLTLATLGLWPQPLHAIQHRIRDRQLRRLRHDPNALALVKQLGQQWESLTRAAASEAHADCAGSADNYSRPPAKPTTLDQALQRLDGLIEEGLLEFAGHTLSHSHAADAHPCSAEDDAHPGHSHAHNDDGCEHSHAPVDWRREDAQLAGLHALRFGLMGEKDYQVGALIDHVHARSRLSAA